MSRVRQTIHLRKVGLLGGAEQSFVVAAAVEDADDRHRLIDDGICDHNALAIADRS